MKNVEAIKYLDNMEQGGFLTIKVPISRNQYIPVTAMFVGKDKDGRYEFLYTGEMVMSKDLLIRSGVRIDIWTHFMRGCIIDYVH